MVPTSMSAETNKFVDRSAAGIRRRRKVFSYCRRVKKPLSSSFLHRFMSAMSSGLRSAALGLIPCWLINFKTEAMPGKLGQGLRGKDSEIV